MDLITALEKRWKATPYFILRQIAPSMKRQYHAAAEEGGGGPRRYLDMRWQKLFFAGMISLDKDTNNQNMSIA